MCEIVTCYFEGMIKFKLMKRCEIPITIKNFVSKVKKNRSMGPLLIWPYITIVVNVIFEEIVILIIVRHIVSSRRTILQKKTVVKCRCQ